MRTVRSWGWTGVVVALLWGSASAITAAAPAPAPFDITRIGHGGSDPGVRTEMLADLSHGTAVILMVNTSVEGAGAKAYADLLADLWAHAEALRRANAPHR